MSLNHITLMGRLTADPEIRTTESGVPVVNFTLAVDRDYTPQGAEKQADFVPITAWRNLAKVVTAYFTKGRMMAVDGRLESRKYVDKDGNNRTAWGVTANNVYFCDSRRDGDSAPLPLPSDAPSEFRDVPEDDGDLPF